MRTPVSLTLTLLLVAFLAACSPKATQPGGPAVAPASLPALSAASFTSGEAFEMLPPGEMLITIDAGTLLNQTVPFALATSPEQKAKFDASLAEMQEKAGIDPKQLKLVAMSFTGLSAKSPQFAGVMTGSFDTAKLTESLKKDPKTGVEAQTEQYNGQTLYIRNDGGSAFAASVLDAGTLVMGSSAAILHQVIDARDKKADNATKDAALFDAFKATDQGGLVRFAMKFPKDQIPPDQAAKDPTMRSFAAINYLTGSLNSTAGLGLNLTAKTSSPADAQPLHDNIQQGLDAAKQYANGDEQGKTFLPILNATTLTTTGNDVVLAMNIPPDQLVMLASQLQKMAPAFGGAMGGAAGGPGGRANGNANSDDH
jgi:hypothetical protein